ncbi:PREDICTED: claw keratin-like isoform X2 [Charadrius vociferus]|uniref:claw keratin-like isoform X2 n=1 Tax=Charadrius vociferus TaxID=50402 RepID=UPI0005213F19|nr:PREDICTED: claw keratin-like isoform X2 [Charadrius vociferus]
MSCSSLCIPSCGVAAPAPLADTANEPCVRQCPDSTVVIQPPASVVTFPGPILSSFPQYSVVGSAGAPGVGGGYGGTFGGRGGFGGFGGYGVYGGLGGSGGYGGLWGLGGWGRLGSCGYGGWRRGHRYLSGNCGPC